MDDVEARKDLFAWYGAAMYAAQLFEVELVVLLLALKRLREPNTGPDEYETLDKLLSKKTLGALLKALEKHCKIDPKFKELLEGYRDTRNFLAHEYFYSRANSLMTRQGIDALTVELQEFEQQLREADTIATKMSENVRIASGIDEMDFQEFVASSLRKEYDLEYDT